MKSLHTIFVWGVSFTSSVVVFFLGSYLAKAIINEIDPDGGGYIIGFILGGVIYRAISKRLKCRQKKANKEQ